MRKSTIRLAAAAFVSSGAFLLASRAGEAAPAPTRGALVMTSFVQNGRIDVRRNEILEFKFSVQLRKGSVDERTLRVDEVSGITEGSVIGARIVKGNIVRFDPRRTQHNYDESKAATSTITELDHHLGFSSYQDFEVELPASPDPRTIKSVNGARLERFFSGKFRTNGSYDDPVAGQPYFLGDHGTGILGFDPPRSGATGLVDEDAIVILEFSEPINIDTLDPSSTIIVTRVTVNEQIPGYVKADPTENSGRRFLFIPSVGFGSDTANQQGWDVQVTLTTGITDLAGNPLKRPVSLPVFRTRYAPGKASCSVVTESFSNQAKMDVVETALGGGEWNTTEKGALRSGAVTTYPNKDYQPTALNTVSTLVRTRVAEPLVAKTVPPTGGGGCSARPTGSRVQMLYVPSEVGIAGAIVAVGWGPASNALFAATHPEVILRMGHTSIGGLGTSFDGNINIGGPEQVYHGQYDIPQAKNILPPGLDTGYYDWPAFQTPFEYDGINNLVFDAACDGANNCQILRIGFVPAVVQYPIRRAASLNFKGTTADFATDSVIYDIRFKKRRRLTQAVSVWYELASDKPIFADPVVSPVGQAGGVSVVVELDGANGKPDPFVVGGFIADPTTRTGYTVIASEIDGHRFFRFRVSMYANLTTNQGARITSIQFPYCF